MAGGINIAFASDVRSVLTGTKDVEGALDKVADALDDVARDGDKSAEKLERSFRESFDKVKTDARKAGDDVGDKIKDGTRRASDGIDDMKQESGSTAREVAANFDGSAESIAEGFQEVAANAFGGFGPAGAAAGLAAAAGMGLITAEMQKAKDEADALEEKVGDLAQAIVDAADPARAMGDQFTETMTDWVVGGELMGKKYADARTELEKAGLAAEDVDTVLRAMAGRPEDQAAAVDILSERQDYFRQVFGRTRDSQAEGYAENMRALMDYTTNVEASAGQIADAEARAREAARLTGQTWVTNAEEARAAYDGVGREIDSLPSTKTTTVKVVADMSSAQQSYDDWVRGIRARGVAVPLRGVPQPV